MNGTEDFSEQSMMKAYQNQCQAMGKAGTLTQERQFLAMMMFLPQSSIEKQMRNTMQKLTQDS